jgi:XRE family transcriptional regulator, regulator of sulfur utilization
MHKKDPRRGPGPRHRYEVLTPPLPGLRAEVSLHSLAAGASTAEPDDPPMHEPGSRETAVVVDGQVRFVCGGRADDLTSGDSVTFDADLPHHFENPGPDEASFYAVVAAGLRRS